ncbi:YdeI/OmpD-associated family protein [Lacticaseibacillus pabuli]|uniref:YdeI/OmpD-associated family protein n=1 Tax=Lacticaseibacillus pabuli TaxID=3025672 RepID=A0ABY7WRH5_9LACO|nr:DUF1801 domain-containing protein [Lacticaseibacillus sp. KACC 23028]WDF82787.1 YdeI/OmpD-associated family protein [Lacticaseibacillus sp. KACC 23028]
MRKKADIGPNASFDDYFKLVDADMVPQMRAMRDILSRALPEATEGISYAMPTYFQAGKAVAYFDAGKGYMGFYPTPGPIVKYADELKPYKHSKGAVQFPADRPLPAELITKMAQFHLAEIKAGTAPRRPRKPQPKPIVTMPGFVHDALTDADLMARYEARPPYQRNDYLGWITQAKREETQLKRLDQMLDELRAGDVYMKAEWHGKQA